MKVTLGGDRLGSGNKNKIALRNYERSTHDLSQKFTSSMQVGALYPFLVLPAMRGDKFTINLDADARTIPTKGPLFGSFKMQVDLFQCDIRLYQAILHNNPLAIGLKMNKVGFPFLKIRDVKGNAFSNSCLLKYLGLSGIGESSETSPDQQGFFRYVNAIPALAYYEIFKTYYSNKQEENAYMVGETIRVGDASQWMLSNPQNDYPMGHVFEPAENETFLLSFEDQPVTDKWVDNLTVSLYHDNTVLSPNQPLKYAIENGYIRVSDDHIQILGLPLLPTTNQPNAIAFNYLDQYYNTAEQNLVPFKLSSIDTMRLKLLSYHTLSGHFTINADANPSDPSNGWDKASGDDHNGLPYTNLCDLSTVGNREYSMNCDNMNGLVVKTYQSDLFNNWVNTDWIDGENGIANVTAISTSSGKIQIDTINLSEKLYNMLNRIAVSDGSYEGWQDAVYTETPKRHIESPVYLGGMSSEIMFEEIVQTSQGDESNPLGTLAGKGRLIKRKGGKVTVKVNEACFIIGIVSLTPRINYSQGNEFYMTELKSMDDFHKPALDGIGFQNLIGERLAWWDTKFNYNSVMQQRSVIGKVPAWIEYMTAVDKCYGDFAETDGKGFMNLLRNYTRSNDGKIADATTYVDPRKYNYAFAYTGLDAQNFWVQIYSHVTARRLMSAKQIPNI